VTSRTLGSTQQHQNATDQCIVRPRKLAATGFITYARGSSNYIPFRPQKRQDYATPASNTSMETSSKKIMCLSHIPNRRQCSVDRVGQAR
jgi:hypothetical protein